jgi:hypothetical protein
MQRSRSLQLYRHYTGRLNLIRVLTAAGASAAPYVLDQEREFPSIRDSEVLSSRPSI